MVYFCSQKYAERVLKQKSSDSWSINYYDCKTMVEQFSVKPKLKYLHRNENHLLVSHFSPEKWGKMSRMSLKRGPALYTNSVSSWYSASSSRTGCCWGLIHSTHIILVATFPFAGRLPPFFLSLIENKAPAQSTHWRSCNITKIGHYTVMR